MNDFLDHVGEYQRELPKLLLQRCYQYRARCMELAQVHGDDFHASFKLLSLSELFEEVCVYVGLGFLQYSVSKFSRAVEVLNSILLEKAMFTETVPAEKDWRPEHFLIHHLR